jgi:hypothetical protein
LPPSARYTLAEPSPIKSPQKRRMVRTRMNLFAFTLVSEAWEREKGWDRNGEPAEEGRVIGIIAAVVIATVPIAPVPITSAVPPMGVIPVTSVIPAVVATMIVSSSMDCGVTGVIRTRVGGGDSEDRNKGKAQCFHGFLTYTIVLSVNCTTALDGLHLIGKKGSAGKCAGVVHAPFRLREPSKFLHPSLEGGLARMDQLNSPENASRDTLNQ